MTWDQWEEDDEEMGGPVETDLPELVDEWRASVRAWVHSLVQAVRTFAGSRARS